MAYCNQQDLWDRFGVAEITQASDHDNDGLENIEAIDAAITDATAIINRYLYRRYVLPLACIPAELIGLACDIARYRLHDNRATEQIKIRYDAAIASLEMYRKRELDLFDEVCGDVFAEIDGKGPVVKARAQVFTDAIFCKHVRSGAR